MTLKEQDIDTKNQDPMGLPSGFMSKHELESMGIPVEFKDLQAAIRNSSYPVVIS